MNDYKHSCVVDAEYFYKDLVLVLMEPDAEGVIHENIQGYKLLDGESLVPCTDVSRQPTLRTHAGAEGFILPRWDHDTQAWIEAATAVEITTWEAAHPAPAVPGPSVQEDTEALIIDHEYRITLMELGVNDNVVSNVKAHD